MSDLFECSDFHLRMCAEKLAELLEYGVRMRHRRHPVNEEVQYIASCIRDLLIIRHKIHRIAEGSK
jgi:hypothetical protein